MESQFPKDFFWGAATSAHQVEGNNRNDWSEWEKSPKRIADLKRRGLNPDDFISGRACDHYHRFREDFDIAKKLCHNAHRFSIEWSRIEPEEGKFDEREIEHYRQVIRALRERGIEPFVTLWHWPFPLWLSAKGRFERKKNMIYFERYCRTVGNAYKNDVTYWMTLNEPEVYAANSYIKGKWPPQYKNVFLGWRVYKNLIQAHRVAYDALRAINPNFQISIAKHNVYFEAYGYKAVNRVLKWGSDKVWNFYFLDKTRDKLDFIGLNHYFHNRINYGFNKNENERTSDIGWELYQESLYHSLIELKTYQKPVIICENGLADAQDTRRADFIRSSVQQMARAVSEGLDVRGYFYWSLLDNFEWDSGFGPRFGLVEVDYPTLGRKIRKSAWEYKRLIEQGL